MACLHLPDLVKHNIFQILPTKAAVRMSFLSKQWEGVWCSSSVLDFDEGDYEESIDCRDNQGDKHRKFINILIRYLRSCGNDKQKKLKLLKLRLHMKGYLFREDPSIVDKLLTCSLDRNVKELDISLRLDRLFQKDWHENENYYCLSRTTFLDATSITTLNLAYVRIKDIRSANSGRPIDHIRRLLPSLKTMSLNNVRFDRHALRSLICFLKEFGRSKNLDLIVADLKNVIFPTEFRNTCSSAILPGLNNSLVLKMSNYLETDSDTCDLEDFLTWIAPSARNISVEKIIGTLLFEF
ncbi:F-box/LRR-repeat protein At5g38396-like [Pyrus communis]|uniref:F-box/LRR-repeat protein At5g38396-like n=1 Tax=Pyrus communis TaxID=23211 RepID=UPI0035BF1FDB